MRRQLTEGQKYRKRTRDDGLVSVVTSQDGVPFEIRWWCRMCHGKQGPNGQPAPDSLEAMYSQWDAHKVTDKHQQRTSAREGLAEQERLLRELFK